MTYLLDTDVVIDFLNGWQSTVEMLDRMSSVQKAISVVTIGEIFHGISGSDDSISAEAQFRQVLEWTIHIPFDVETAIRYGKLRHAVRSNKQAPPIGDGDLMIAATAIHYRMTLITRNLKHFDGIPELVIYDGAGSSE